MRAHPHDRRPPEHRRHRRPVRLSLADVGRARERAVVSDRIRSRRPCHRRRAVMTAAIWTEIIAAVALLFWMNVWFGIAATGIVITVVFILPAALALNGFRGS